ncbi:MAG: M20/M25/M40 family metallo-hydrolase [Methanomassiliicoccales archaeon]|nr:MAG: M20/M25/M40 family metallo-hydrolase [Methanomassiliicoccales archaeon]
MTKIKRGNYGFLSRILLITIAITLVIPFNYIPMGAKAPGPPAFDPTIQEIISKVTEQDVEKYITDLQNFDTRYCYSTKCNLSAQYIFDEFSNYSALSVESDYFVYNSYVVRNIIATLPGMNESDSTVYVVGGHYDSYSKTDRWNNAPGADDDASGTAVALEAAKILSQYRFNSTIIFAAWTAEEVGLIGSSHWVQNAWMSEMDIGAYLNFDMIGYDPDNKMGLDIGHNTDSVWLSEEMVSINENYSIGLNISTGSGSGASDHASFWQWGYPAVECIEHDFNTPNYHTINDTVDKLNMEFDKKVTQLGLATLAKLAGVLTPGVGVIYLDNEAYQPWDTVTIKLYDTDLNLNPSVLEQATVEMSSTTESGPEFVTLTETGTNTSIFIGTIEVAPGAPAIDGVLQVSEGDTILANYIDNDPIGLRSASAVIDGTPPVISGVAAVPGVSSATITWTTDEPSDSTVYYGISPSLGIEVYDSEMVTAHSIKISGLEPSLTYYFDVESKDIANNSQRDDNSGTHYSFTTLLGLTYTAESGYVGWVRQSEPSKNYFNGPDIYVGSGAQGIYHGAVQFNLSLFPKDAIITNASVEFYGKRWYYTGSGGNWVLRMLDDEIDSDWQNRNYTEIHNAVVEDTIPPPMLDDDLQSRHWNTYYFGTDQFSALKHHLVNNTISFRLDGPQSGRYLFVWDTGNTDESWGSEYAPRITISYDPVGDTQGPAISNQQATPNPTYGASEVTVSAVISDEGTGGSNITSVKVYDPISHSWIDMDPEDGLFDSSSEKIQKTMDISSWPDGEHTIYVRGADEAGNWGPLVSMVLIKKQTFDLWLSYGWNLISIPLIQQDTNLGPVLSSIDGFYDAVQWFNIDDTMDQWKHNHTQKPQVMNDLDHLNHTRGFWIHITKPGGVLLQGTGSPFLENQTVTLYPGWNLVGYPSASNKSREGALNNIDFPTEVDSIWSFNAETGQWKELGEFDDFILGCGYWIRSVVKKTWQVPR